MSRRLFSLFCIGFLIGPVLFAQNTNTAPQDSVQTRSLESGELVLDEIEIQGQIEKPGVIVLPKRVEPDIGNMELDRSFDNELKNGVETLPEPDEALGEVEGVKSIKKAVERKRN